MKNWKAKTLVGAALASFALAAGAQWKPNKPITIIAEDFNQGDKLRVYADAMESGAGTKI